MTKKTKPFTVIFTGSRDYILGWKVDDWVLKYWREHDYKVLIKFGDCPTGVDKFAKSMCKTAGIPFEEFFADWDKYGKAAGPKRNHEMVDSGADLCVAFPRNESRGTKDCAEYAHSKGIKVEFPDLPKWSQWAAPIATF